jgi:hypothetical protein
LFTGEKQEYLLGHFIQHLSVSLLLLIQPLLRNIAVLDWNRKESDHYDAIN